MKKRTTYFILNTIIASMLFAGYVTYKMAWNGAEKEWYRIASAYDTKENFIKLNFYAEARYLGLKIGLEDNGTILGAITDWQEEAYQQGVAHIPKTDSERLYWDYMFYLRPYEGNFLERDQVYSLRKKLEIAQNIIFTLGKHPAENRNLMLEHGLRILLFSYRALYTDYFIKGIPETKKDLYKGLKNSWHYFYALQDYLRPNKGAFSAYLNARSLQWSERQLVYYTDYIVRGFSSLSRSTETVVRIYGCNHEMISLYQKVRSDLPFFVKPFLGLMQHKKDATKELIESINYSHFSKFQESTEETLNKHCNISFQKDKP